MTHVLMNSYVKLSPGFTRGDGAWLYDAEGNQYLDALSGIAVCGLGHSHPAVNEAICSQAGLLIHTSNLYEIPLQEQLASRLVALAGMTNAFFGNSGAEANEAAIKIARLHGNQQGFTEPVIIVMEGSFHGRTLATLSATGNSRVQKGFEPLLRGFLRVPYNDLKALEDLGDKSGQIVAILVEPILGEGGIVVPDNGYLQGIRRICDANGWLMMLDEIQTGMCRSGKWFAYQHEQVVPDVMTLAKALGNGFPIGACLAHGVAADLIQPGSHGSTFGGNPLASRVVLTVLESTEALSLDKRAAVLGERMRKEFLNNLNGLDGIKEIRGKGMMFGIELDRPCTELVTMALENKLLINVTAGNVVRLLPPLIISDAEADQIVSTVCKLINVFLSKPPRG
jgi:acetylornithine aminotransferase